MTGPRTTRHRGQWLLVAATTIWWAAAFLSPAAVDAAAPQFGLVSQTFNVPADGQLRFTVSLPDGVAPADDDFVLAVTAFEPVESRQDVADALIGEFAGRIDGVEIPPTRVSRPEPDQLRATVPVEVTSLTDEALQLSAPGVYPVLIELREGDATTAELVTFVHRVASDEEGVEDPMPTTVAMSTTLPVRLDDNADVIVDRDTVRELGTLAELLESSAVPVAVRVPPAVLTALAQRDEPGARLVDRISNAMEIHDLLSSTALPLDPSLAAQADEGALYTQWLRDGEDELDATITSPAQRTMTIIGQPLSRAGGSLLRDLGTRLLVLPQELYNTLPGTLGGFTDTTQLVQIQVADGVTIDAALPDRIAADMLARETATPTLSAIHAVADLLALRQEVEDSGGDPRRHGVTLATPDIGLPSLSGFGEFTALLADTPGLRPTTLDDLGVRTDQLLGTEGPVVVDLPATVPGDLRQRMAVVDSLTLDAVSTASMFAEDDPRPDEWARLIGTLPTSGLTDDQVAAIETNLTAQMRGIRDSIVVPDGFRFNLTGRTGSVPVTLRNDADIPLRVRVRMSSSKLLFPAGDQVVVLEPNAFTEVRIDIEARTNGRFPVSLEVFTPVGDVALAPPVPLTASINALSGVGNLLTGAALLVLLSWWVRHLRRNRRARHAAEAANRHPATRDEHVDPGEADELSPDAATSTLPPS